MFDWLKKKVPCTGSVCFPGSLRPSAESFAHMEKDGVEISSQAPQENMNWALRLRHPEWGQAFLVSFRDDCRQESLSLQFAPRLTAREKEKAAAPGVRVVLRMAAKEQNILRDRKRMLRFLRSAMGTDGIVAADHISTLYWSPAALDEELSHDADLDISQVYAVHSVTTDDGERAFWLHSHGLSEIGCFDYHILEPSREVTGSHSDVLCAIAYAIVEERVTMSTDRFLVALPRGEIRLVKLSEFRKRGDPKLAEKIVEERKRQAVICEPAGGFLGRLFSPRPRPSRYLSRPMPGETVCLFSGDATALMADRARKTLGVLRRLEAELGEFEFPVMAKLSFDTEHMWFKVHGIEDDSIDATLENDPFQRTDMKRGDRGRHPVEKLSDWQVQTPLGPITPRSLAVYRAMKDNWDQMLTILEKMKQREPAP